jgi:hypothetical protein
MNRALAARVALAAASAVTLVLTCSVMLGSTYKWKLLGIPVRASDFTRPLLLGAALAAVLLVYGWKQRGFRLVAVALLAASATFALAGYARQAPAYAPVGDMALLESYTIDASSGNLLVGPYSRFAWHHPGPVYFYLLAPFYALGDHRSVAINAAALWINLSSLLALAWILVSFGRGRLAVVTVMLTALYLFRVREILASPWNPHVLVLPTLLLVALSAALASGRLGLMPLVAGLATFIVQTHVGQVPAALALSGSSAAAAIILTRRSGDPSARARIFRAVNLTMWVLAVLWFLPVAEQVTEQARGAQGNLATLWQFFTSPDRHGQLPAAAFTAWGETLSAMLRREIHVGWGLVFRSGSGWMAPILSVLQVSLLVVIAIRSGRQGRRFTCALAALLALTSLVGFWSAKRVEGPLVDYAIFWVSGLGALNLAVVVDELLELAWRRPIHRSRPIAIAACAALWLAVAAIGVHQVRLAVVRAAAPGLHERIAMTLSEQIGEYLRNHAGTKPLIRIDPAVWSDAAGVVVALQRTGVPFGVDRDWRWMFTDALAPAGDENVILTIGREGVRDQLAAESGAITIGEYGGVFAALTRSLK